MPAGSGLHARLLQREHLQVQFRRKLFLKYLPVQYYKIFFRYSWIMLVPSFVGIIPSVLMKSVFPFIGILVFFSLIGLLNLSMKGTTEFIELVDFNVSIKKKGRLAKNIDLKTAKVYYVKSKNWWAGITFEYENNSRETIWSYEFDKDTWKAIEKYLNNRIEFSAPQNDYTGRKF